MTKAIDNTKKTRGRPKVQTEPVMVRLPTSMIAAIESYRREREEIPSRPEAIRQMLAEWLKEHGYLTS